MIEIKCTEKERIKLEPFLKDYACIQDKCINDCTNCLDNYVKWDIQPEKLKPCPFCGSENVKMLRDSDMEYIEYQVFCCGCGTTGGEYTLENEAIENWNSRAGNGERERS